MKANIKGIILASALALAAIASGCATVGTEGTGGSDQPDILSLIEHSSQGK